MRLEDGPIRGVDGSRIEISLSWLDPLEAKTFKDQLDREFKRWRFRRMPLDGYITAALGSTCRKKFPNLTVGVSPLGYRLISSGSRGKSWYSSSEFQQLLTAKASSHEDYLLAKLAYGGATGKPSMEIRYNGGPSRLAKLRNIYPWGLRVETAEGIRNMRWDKLTAIRILMSDERIPTRKLQLYSLDETLVSTWFRRDLPNPGIEEFV